LDIVISTVKFLASVGLKLDVILGRMVKTYVFLYASNQVLY
jgi:hypothetical protein